jgi:hypothetical protein
MNDALPPEPNANAEKMYEVPSSVRGVEEAGVIDVIAYNGATGEVTLGLIERREWDDSDEQLFQLQEKLNTYVSFALDGELAEAYPDLANKPLRIKLQCPGRPTGRALGFLEAVRRQISFQGIRLEVVVSPTAENNEQ